MNPLNLNKIYASPEITQHMKVDFIPMSLYTGKLNLDIPLFHIKSGDIEVPISLRYNSNGIKVEEEASNVGLGWVLEAGGYLTKMTRDINDNEITIKRVINGSGMTNDPFMPGGSYVYSTGILKNQSDYPVVNYNNPSITTDGLPDLFFCSAPSLNSKFIFERVGNDISIKDINNPANRILAGNYTNFGDELNNYNSLIWLGVNRIFPKVYNNVPYLASLIENYMTQDNYTFLKGKAKDYESFVLTNSSGLKYEFSTYDLSVSCPQIINTDIPLADMNLMKYSLIEYVKENYNLVKSTWNLDKISDNKNHNVNFIYKKFSDSYVRKYLDYTFYSEENINSTQLNNNLDINRLLGGQEYNSTNANNLNQERSLHTRNVIYNYIEKIIWDEGVVEFKYDYNRQDADNKFALSEIIVRNSIVGTVIKKFVFNYTYFESNPVLASSPLFLTKRLKLSSIDLIDENGIVFNNWYTFGYEDVTNLPSRESLEVDYLGYYNNNGFNLNQQILSGALPKLYFVENRYNNSITPFPVNNSQVLEGYLSLNANNNSLSGLLKKIKNPSGAINEFVYESNDFNFFGQTILGGGARIKKQIIKEANSIVKEYNYQYIDENGNSSGYINNVPRFSDLVTTNYNDSQIFVKYLRSKGNVELTEGAFVGYSRVVESEQDNGFVEKKFFSPNDFENLYPTTSANSIILQNSPMYLGIYADQDIKRGKIKEINYYDKFNNILKKEKYNYQEIILQNKSRSFKKAIQSFNPYSVSPQAVIDFNIQYDRKNYLLLSEDIEEFFYGEKIKKSASYDYNNAHLQLTSKSVTSSQNFQLLKKYYYADEYNHTSMINENMVGIPLKTETYSNNNLISSREIVYEKKSSNFNLILPTQVKERKDLVQTSQTIQTYDFYDDKGNVLQFTERNDLTTAVIWGYNNSLPIAKVENATYSQVEPYVANLQSLSNGINEASLITALNNLRNALPNAMVTTYTYKPLVGVTSITDPKGYKTTYHYDGFNRLEYVKDKDGHILSQNEYHYKN
ncbi:putative YD repeat-containing protein [Flavobacterium sp. 9AF]|nr:putative YD repeat-containing protein [Flavobacterium sp. 9AF]